MRLLKILFLACFILTFFNSRIVAQIAVIGETVYTMAGEPISNGVVLISNGLIEQVGTADNIQIPDEYEVFRAEVVTPGLIDSRSVVGLAGILNQEHDQDQVEMSNAFQPELRAMDAYNAREDLVKFILRKGITTVHTGHGPGALVSGQTMIVKTAGNTLEESLVDSTTAIAITLGAGIRGDYSTPGTRAKSVAMFRQHLIDGREYSESRNSNSPPSRDLQKEVIADLLDGNIYALIHVQRAQDIMTAIRLQREFGFPMMLEGAAESYLVIDEIKEAGVPVIIHPTMVRTWGETQNASFETASKLKEAGIQVIFQSGYEGYVPKTRVALFEAAIAVANGLDPMEALRSLTIDAAYQFGIDDRVGSLEIGKDADLVLFNGDPFEYTTRAQAVIVDGEVVFELNSF
jgi:imidazolonepropionase-like amidohydrolase